MAPPLEAVYPSGVFLGNPGRMPTRIASLLALLTVLPGAQAEAGAQAPSASTAAAAMVKEYCVTCHSSRAKAGGLVLEGQDPAHAARQPEMWERVVRKLRA